MLNARGILNLKAEPIEEKIISGCHECGEPNEFKWEGYNALHFFHKHNKETKHKTWAEIIVELAANDTVIVGLTLDKNSELNTSSAQRLTHAPILKGNRKN